MFEDVGAVEYEVVCGDGGGDFCVCVGDEVDGVSGGEVFEDDFEFGVLCDEGYEDVLDEEFFAVEYVDLRVCDFAMDEEGHIDFGHGVEDGSTSFPIGDTEMRFCGGTSWVVFDGEEVAIFVSFEDGFREGVFLEVAGNEGCE